MELTCSRGAMLEGLTIVKRTLPRPKKDISPLLLNVVIRAEENGLGFWATDSKVTLGCRIGARIVEPGAIAVSGRFLFKALKALRCDDVQLKTQAPATLYLQCPGVNVVIEGTEAGQFSTPEMPVGPWIRFGAEELGRGLRQASIAASTNQFKPTLTGVLLEVSSNKLTAVGVDGFRLSVVTCELLEAAQEPISAIVPANVLMHFARSIGREGEVAFCVVPEQQQVFFRARNVWLVSHTIRGYFPDYEDLIPKQYLTRAAIDRNSLLLAVQAVRPFAKKAYFITYLHMMPSESKESVSLEGGSIEVIAVVKGLGSNTIKLPAHVGGKEVEVALNSKYLTNFLTVVDADQVEILISKFHHLILIRPVGRKEEFLHLLMPMHVRRSTA